MEFDHQFLPLAGEVGLLPVLTWFFMFVTFYAFVGQFIFALASRSSVAPIHHNSQTLTAIIAAVAGISYYVIQDYFRHRLATWRTLLRLVCYSKTRFRPSTSYATSTGP